MEVLSNEFDGFCLSEMPCCGVVMVVVDNLEAEILVVRNVELILKEETVGLPSPTTQGICGVYFLDHQLCEVVIQDDG